jgi:hypothetical protein
MTHSQWLHGTDLYQGCDRGKTQMVPDNSFPDANGTYHSSVGLTSSITAPRPHRGRNQCPNIRQEG